MKKYLIVVFVGFVLIGAFRTTATSDDSKRDEAGEVVEGGEVGVLAISVNDCFDRPIDGAGGFGSVEVKPCHEPHDNQVFGKFELPGEMVPESETAAEAIYLGCVDRFEGAIGRPFAESMLEIMPLAPTEEGWKLDRGVVCTVYHPDGTKLTYDAIVG